MIVIRNSESPALTAEEEQMFESVVRDISADLAESVVARGVKSLDYLTYSDEQGRRVAFEFRPAGVPQVPLAEFQRVLSMRFVQILWERYGKRCLPVGLEKKDESFTPWQGGQPDYVLAQQPTDGESGALPPGLAGPDASRS